MLPRHTRTGMGRGRSSSGQGELPKQYERYFQVCETPARGRKVTAKQEAIDEAKKNYGYFAMISNEIKDPSHALDIYRNKDLVEETWKFEGTERGYRTGARLPFDWAGGATGNVKCPMLDEKRGAILVRRGLICLEPFLQQDGIFNVYTENEVQRESHTRSVTFQPRVYSAIYPHKYSRL